MHIQLHTVYNISLYHVLQATQRCVYESLQFTHKLKKIYRRCTIVLTVCNKTWKVLFIFPTWDVYPHREKYLFLCRNSLYLYSIGQSSRHTPCGWDYTECTQSGNGHFMAYIPSWWKNQPSLVGVGGFTPTPFHYIYHHVQGCSVRSSWEGRYTPPTSALPLYELCDWDIHKCYVCQ